MAKTTIQDVAQAAGVSTATVSNVLNGKGRVSEVERERIKSVIDALGFVQNPSARQLAKKRSGLISIFAPDADYLSSSMFFAALTSGAVEVAAASKINVVISTVNPENYLKTFVGIDGAIVINPQSQHDWNSRLVDSDIPVVVVGRPQENEACLNYVDVENISISYNLCRHLTELGHRNILLLTGPEDLTITIDQLSGYRRALVEAGVGDGGRIVYTDYFIDSCREEILRMFEESGRPTAVICASDNLAMSVINILSAMKLNVPKDVSVVCLAGSFLTENYLPKITGVVSPGRELGRAAAEILVANLKKKLLRATSRIMDYKITFGDTTAKVRPGRKKNSEKVFDRPLDDSAGGAARRLHRQ